MTFEQFSCLDPMVQAVISVCIAVVLIIFFIGLFDIQIRK